MPDRLRLSKLLVLTAAPIGCACLAALAWIASSIGADEAHWAARAKTLDQPELWSIEALPAPAGWRPVTICADVRMRSGFTHAGASVGADPCRPVGWPVETPGRTAQQCTVRGQTIGQSATYRGDLARDFTTTFTYVHLDRQLAGGAGGTYSQTLRFRRLGPCPEGWRIGDHTDRHGRRQADARITRGWVSS
jgi:hypothetical protein